MKLTVLVTGIGGGGLGEQLIKAFRIAKGVEYTIVGTDVTKLSHGAPYVDIFETVPFANSPDYIDALINICKQHGAIAIFPGSEPELKAVSDARNKIKAAGIFLPINPAAVLDICFDKLATVAFLKAQGLKYPKSFRITSESDLEEVDVLPVVLKPSVGGSGSANIMVAQTKEELLVFGKYLLNSYSEYIIQEYVGLPEEEYTVGVLCGMDGTIINSIALRRFITSGLGMKHKMTNRTGREELGKHLIISSGISQGEIGRYEHITKPCEEIAKSLGATSALNIQCRYWKGEIYVFEINPRYSGTTSLRAMMGYNEPDIMIKQHFASEDVATQFEYRRGIILRGLNEVAISS